MNYFIHRALAKQPLQVFGTGEQTRNVMYAEDAAEILWQAAIDERLYGGLFFATSSFHHTVLEIAEAISQVLDAPPVEHVPWPENRLKIEVGNARFSSEKLRALTGWQARYDFREGLEKTKAVMENFLSLA